MPGVPIGGQRMNPPGYQPIAGQNLPLALQRTVDPNAGSMSQLSYLQQLIAQALQGANIGPQAPAAPPRPGTAGAPTAALGNAANAGGYQGAANQLSMGGRPRMVGRGWVSPWLRGLPG